MPSPAKEVRPTSSEKESRVTPDDLNFFPCLRTCVYSHIDADIGTDAIKSIA